MTRTVRGRVLSIVLSYVLLVAAAAVAVYPVVLILGVSLRPADRLFTTSLRLIPRDATLAAYHRLLFDKPFLTWVRNSALVTAVVTLVSLACAALAGYAFSRFRFRGKSTGLIGLLVTQMFPATMVILPLYVLMQGLRLINTLPGLMIAYTATALPFCVWTMKGYYDTIPVALEEAARIDGASQMGAFARVALPLAAPGLAVTALFSFMAGWSEFIVARVIISSSPLYTLPLGLASLQSTFRTEWATLAAGSLIVSAPAVALFLVLNRYLVGGLTVGGVKG
jgi:arabinogalactan oligomer/maltooligosaccharide transport system permease protein